MCETSARWALAYHTNSRSPRARRWYRVSRMVYVDGGWFELYWHPDTGLRGDNQVFVRRAANTQGLDVLPGLFRDKQAPRRGGEMELIS